MKIISTRFQKVNDSELTCDYFKTHRERCQVDQNARWTTPSPPLQADNPNLPVVSIPMPHFQKLHPFNREIYMETELKLYCSR